MNASRSNSSGFSLVEVVVALAITVFCLLTLLGLLSVGTVNNASSLDQTVATNIAAGIVSDLRATPLTGPGAGGTSPRYLIPIPAWGGAVTGSSVSHTLYLDNNGTVSGTIDTNASTAGTVTPLYRATVTFTTPAAGTRTATFVRVLITWPALSDATAATLPSRFIGSFDTVIALDRN